MVGQTLIGEVTQILSSHTPGDLLTAARREFLATKVDNAVDVDYEWPIRPKLDQGKLPNELLRSFVISNNVRCNCRLMTLSANKVNSAGGVNCVSFRNELVQILNPEKRKFKQFARRS